MEGKIEFVENGRAILKKGVYRLDCTKSEFNSEDYDLTLSYDKNDEVISVITINGSDTNPYTHTNSTTIHTKVHEILIGWSYLSSGKLGIYMDVFLDICNLNQDMEGIPLSYIIDRICDLGLFVEQDMVCRGIGAFPDDFLRDKVYQMARLEYMIKNNMSIHQNNDKLKEALSKCRYVKSILLYRIYRIKHPERNALLYDPEPKTIEGALELLKQTPEP